jgi:hypothetical protein
MRLGPRAGAGLAGAPVAVLRDPTVRGGRLVPEDVREARAWGAEPGGGVRATVTGVRILLSGDALLTATVRLPSTPSAVVGVPERMGGGFLYVLGSQVWRSDTWLGDARALVRSTSAIGDVLMGLDRAYVLLPGGTLAAFDPATGASEDLGSLPASPRMGRIAALDAWHAVAIVDFRSALVTADAGASWRPLDIGVEPVDISTASGALVLRGLDPNRQAQFWEIARDGQALRLPSEPPAPSPGAALEVWASSRAGGLLGASPLAAVVEDGWPLGDGTAVVARSGSLSRVRLDDGTIVQSVPDAFALHSARCHPLSLATTTAPAAFGFVCGELNGKTALYRWTASRSGLAELRVFDEPREAQAFGNGAIAVRGGCATDAPAESSGADDERVWCVMTADGSWTERHFRGEAVDRARIVALGDGRIALVRPPEGELATARLTLTDGVSAQHRSLRFPLLKDDVTKALLHGVWLDGFEERRPGVLGGWVDSAGSLLGIEIALDGSVRVGEYIRDAGAPIASGRWAFGWTASRRAFETTDGGMTWTKGVDVPDPLAPVGTSRERACGPVGCVAAGWLKIGWTDAAQPEVMAAPLAPLLASPASRAPAPVRLTCERLAVEALGPTTVGSGARLGFGQPTVVPTGASLPGFCARPAPPRPADTVAIVSEIADGAGWPRRAGPVGMVYAWGPQGGDWDRTGRWEVRWRSLWGGCGSASGPAPWSTVDAAGRALGRSGGNAAPLTLQGGEDATRALLVARRAGTFELSTLDAGHPPLDVHRADGDMFPDIEASLQSGPRWYVASAQSAGQRSATVIWEIDGDVAREVGRLPRAGPEGRSSIHLARRIEGRAIGVVVEGHPDATQASRFWIESLDPETGEVGLPEPLAALDLGGQRPAACNGDDDGWLVELPYSGSVELSIGPGAPSPLQTPLITMRLSATSGCIERVAGFGPDDAPPVAAGSPTPSLPGGRQLEASLSSSKGRVPFRCRLP